MEVSSRLNEYFISRPPRRKIVKDPGDYFSSGHSTFYERECRKAEQMREKAKGVPVRLSELRRRSQMDYTYIQPKSPISPTWSLSTASPPVSPATPTYASIPSLPQYTYTKVGGGHVFDVKPSEPEAASMEYFEEKKVYDHQRAYYQHRFTKKSYRQSPLESLNELPEYQPERHIKESIEEPKRLSYTIIESARSPPIETKEKPLEGNPKISILITTEVFVEHWDAITGVKLWL